MSHTRLRVNPHYSALNVKELLARNRREIWSLTDCNGTRTHNYLASLAKWLSVRLRTKWLWVRVLLQSRSKTLTKQLLIGSKKIDNKSAMHKSNSKKQLYCKRCLSRKDNIFANKFRKERPSKVKELAKRLIFFSNWTVKVPHLPPTVPNLLTTVRL